MTKTIDNDFPASKCMAVVNDYIRDPKHRAVYAKKLTEGYTNDQLAEEFGYSVQQVSNILNECRTAVEKHIHEYESIPNAFIVQVTEDGTMKIRTYNGPTLCQYN